MSNFADLPTMLSMQIAHVSFRQLQAVQQHFGSLQTALESPQADWQRGELLSEAQLAILFADDLQARLDEALAWGEENNQAWLLLGDKEYPQSLTEISEAPIVLGVRGNIELLSDPQIAIVGSRHASRLGVETAKDFAKHLSSQGLAITSGLALGIDTAAHKGALEGVGKTVAVVATGLDRIYPASNQKLGHQIAEEGAMISEFPLGTKPLNYNFPRRNRIISGLSLGTLVVEAALKSGSLITARTALEQGREVFAVPGSIHNPLAKGCHQLIKQGAKLVESGQDVLEELSSNLQSTLNLFAEQSTVEKKSASAVNTQSQSKLLEWIGYDAIGLDELVVLSKMPVSSLQGELMLLELSGEVEALSAARWRRIR
ncbi:DNA processing protein DprA [Thiomicrorhabdus immobilis]|uniref:DNA processing protein DprA n=1 Tax=Thiomicrorhabdus immobilis TaxID=2791037 RepID=A0ABN6CU17_9GAMM|nr:DNA-processing protein DprA [Thiomicrorhabdus immobilis]BCN92455.1 DNA processing protein DprA [Thiomicrorhabdus immobilis]